MKLDLLTDLLFAGAVAVPVVLAAVGDLTLALLALVALPIIAGLTAAAAPDAPFRRPAEHLAERDGPGVTYPGDSFPSMLLDHAAVVTYPRDGGSMPGPRHTDVPPGL